MNSLKQSDVVALIEDNRDNPKIYGIYRNRDGQVVLDRRYTAEAIAASGILNPRIADLNIDGPDIIEIPDELAAGLGILNTPDNQV